MSRVSDTVSTAMLTGRKGRDSSMGMAVGTFRGIGGRRRMREGWAARAGFGCWALRRPPRGVRAAVPRMTTVAAPCWAWERSPSAVRWAGAPPPGGGRDRIPAQPAAPRSRATSISRTPRAGPSTWPASTPGPPRRIAARPSTGPASSAGGADRRQLHPHVGDRRRGRPQRARADQPPPLREDRRRPVRPDQVRRRLLRPHTRARDRGRPDAACMSARCCSTAGACNSGSRGIPSTPRPGRPATTSTASTATRATRASAATCRR